MRGGGGLQPESPSQPTSPSWRRRSSVTTPVPPHSGARVFMPRLDTRLLHRLLPLNRASEVRGCVLETETGYRRATAAPDGVVGVVSSEL
jgi:hypothetical protein